MALFRKAEKATQDLEAKLAKVLSQLEQDPNNPDLWYEAAKGYMELGNLEQAQKCAESCLNVDSTRGDAKLLIDDITSIIESQEEAAESPKEDKIVELAEPMKEETPDPDEEGDSEPESEEPEKTLRGVPWVPEEERPRFKDEQEALEELRRELNPSSTTTCPGCNTLLEVDTKWCYGCGREVTEKLETLDQRMDLARSKLEVDETDADALFAMAAFDAVSGDPQAALEILHKLSKVDGNYPGLWWLKARVFEMLGMREAAEAAVKRAIEIGAPIVESP